MRSDSEDQMFVNRCLGGDWAAFAFLVDKYKEVVHAYAYHRVNDYQAAQDITQEVLIKAYSKLGQLKWPHRFRSWLYTIASNECKMWFRKNSKEREQEVAWDDVPVEELDQLAVRNHSDEDIRLTVRSAMETLPDANKLALSLYYMSSLSVSEIAEFMGVSPNSVRIRLHRARRQLGERMEKMIGKQLKKEKLRSGFVMTMMNTVKNIPVPSLPKPRSIKWAPIPISIGTALLIGVIGFGISSGGDVWQDMPVLKPLEATWEVSLLPDLDSYPEQAEAVTMADERLSLLLGTEAAIGEEDKEFNIRQVWADPDIVGIYGAPSPDGRYLSYVDWDTGNLAIYEISTGKKRRLTNHNWDESSEYAIFSRWSPDGKQIVYQWYNDSEKFVELRIIGLDGSKPRILYSNEDEYAEIYDWSTDGKQILAFLDGSDQIVSVSAADGSVRVLKILEQGDPKNMSFSPDGRCIVYDFPQKEDSPEHDISLLSTNGSREISLVEHPAHDYILGWAPDGKNILFASDRTGTLCAWLIAVADGKPQGAPELVKPDIGGLFVPMGFTRDGSFYYGCQGGRIHDVYIAKLDPETGEILGPPKKVIKRFEGYNQSPDYSPDGKYLAYISTRGTFGMILNRPRVLCIRSLETGEEREFFPKLKRINLIRWSPDCSSILFVGLDNNNRWGIYQIDTQTGDVTSIVLSGSSVDWSHDGKAIFYVRSNNTNNLRQILVRNLESGTEKELYRTSDDDRFYLSCSPDGKWLAFAKRGDNKGVLRIMPAAGGEPRELYRCKQEEEGNFVTLRWTPDGKYILFVTSQPEENSLWRIPIEGGKPEKLGLLMNGFYKLSVHPDGQHIAFYNSTSRLAEVWVMENFLPGFTAAR